MITSACRNHAHILTTPTRLGEWEDKLRQLVAGIDDADMRAWVILPNHYHLLLKVDLARLKVKIGRLHNGVATQWNREDETAGRSVWFRFSDRVIRSERHYYAAINYIHYNPVKHGLVRKSADWPWSSIHHYLQTMGHDEVKRIWDAYPVGEMGKGWDD